MTNFSNGQHSPKYKVLIDEQEFEFTNNKVTSQDLLTIAGRLPVTCHSVYLKKQGCDFEYISADTIVDLSMPGIEKFTVKEPLVFPYTVNNEPELTDLKHLTALQILVNAGGNINNEFLVLLNPDGTEVEFAENPGASIQMVCTGLNFITRKWLDLIDIEITGKTCAIVVTAKQYRIRVDKDYFIVNNASITGKQLLILTNKNPVEKFDIFKITSTNPQPQKVSHDEHVNLKEKCLTRFVTLPREQQDGLVRREFLLPIDDIDFLNAKGLHWETFHENGMNWILLHDFIIPEGYNVRKATIGLMIPPNYPAAEIDMAYFFPALQKLSNSPIKNLTAQAIEGKSFQRWSRHRSAGDWRPGLDNLSTHLILVNNWLLKDLNR